ncbi:phosphopantetheine-binding protein [Pseudoroseicyclus aestuarii]|uniref:Aryl carrier-like protein n=1 Tax=Pseudoroseicyclus aestuarii TaxID=1795041 RepID=A0A318T2N7_9RHOB|nr:phosphopantetheine-binding protein [Pseudoroseicyclus aestuarii]PYE84484.1 aryl carrier-like protein [Pseudoroseicyclus aestuarii]
MLTFDEMRADVARVVHEAPEDIDPDENLADLGIDSMRAMRLLMAWEERLPGLDYGAFMEEPTLSGWWAVVQARQSAGA